MTESEKVWANGQFDRLPGAELIGPGLRDAGSGRRTPLACLVWIAEPRLRSAGLIGPEFPPPIPEPERSLYALLRGEAGDAYPRYNALLRRLVSFERALPEIDPLPHHQDGNRPVPRAL